MLCLVAVQTYSKHSKHSCRLLHPALVTHASATAQPCPTRYAWPLHAAAFAVRILEATQDMEVLLLCHLDHQFCSTYSWRCIRPIRFVRRCYMDVVKLGCCQIWLQAKVKEPELYELHDRVTQIRKEMDGPVDGKDVATQHNLAQNGVATQ